MKIKRKKKKNNKEGKLMYATLVWELFFKNFYEKRKK